MTPMSVGDGDGRAPRGGRPRRVAALVLLVLGTVGPAWAAAGPADAARLPVYRDPPTYKGISRAPATVAPKPPAPTVLAAAGTFPDVVVDEAGTAHIVWNENRGDAADVVLYCRLKRGARACDGSPTELKWDKGYDVGDGPQYNVGGPPKIVRVGDQLVVLSYRYPTIGVKPDGSSSSTTVAWSSGDGGTSWTTQAAVVGRNALGQVVSVDTGQDVTILNFGVDPLCSAPGPASACLQAFSSAQYNGASGNLTTGPDQNYDPNLTLDAQGRPVISVSDLARRTIVRRWQGTGSPQDPAQWTAPSVFGADQVSLSGGPAGVFMMAKPAAGYGPYSVTRLQEGAGGYTAGPAAAISPAADSVLGRLHQDPSGRLIAAWEQRRVGLQLRATGGAAGTTAAFAPATTLAPGDDNGQIALGAAGDGGGFAVFNHTGGINGEGQILASGVGAQGPTGRPGIAGVPAGPGVTAGGAGTNGSCQQLGFGSFTIDAAGCILKGKGADAQNYVASTEINLWGLRIVPDAGVKIVINPKTFELNTTGGVRVIVSAPQPVGDVVLYHGVLKRDLRAVLPGTTLFEFPSGDFKANLLGFDISANIKVRLEKDGVHIPVDLKLPPAFGNFTGHAELVADRTRGLHVDSLHVHLGPIPLGALLINSVDIDYQGAGDVWTGAGAMTVPAGGRLDIMARFAMGDFEQATFTFKPGTPIPIGPFVYLLDFGGGFGVKPAVVINANATLGVGAAVNGESPVKVHGDFTMTFPKLGPADFRLKGTVALFFLQVGDGSLDFQSDGYAAFRGHSGVTFGPLSVNADVDGFVDAPTGKYGASVKGQVSLCAEIVVRLCVDAGADAAVSSLGFAACGHGEVLGETVEVGLSYPWADWNPAFLVEPPLFLGSLITHIGPCHVDQYRVAPTRARAAQAGGGIPVPVGAGLPTKTILVKGTGGVPQVSVAGPGGRTVSSGKVGPAGYVMTVPGIDAAYVVLTRPAAGTWTVTTLPGSPAAAQLLTADGYLPATVTARVGGHGRARSIAYRIGRLGHGQRVSFQESGAFGTHLLGSTGKAAGTLRFVPADVRGGTRTVTALVEHDGVVTDRVRVGSYVAPGPVAPAAVRGLRTRRAGTTLTVTWRPVTGAARYAITLTGARGTRLGRLVTAPARSVRFAAVRRDERIAVQVRAISRKLRTGPPATTVARPVR